MKRIIALTLIIAACLSGCRNMVDESKKELVVYASFRPIYALLSGLTRDVPLMSARCLAPPLYECPRNYSLSYWDAAKLYDADALFIGARGLESYENSLETASFAVVAVMSDMELLGQEDDTIEGDETSHFYGANPWAWLSVGKTIEMLNVMAGALGQLDSVYDYKYFENLETMTGRLEDLKEEMSALLPGDKPLVAVMHEGFAYFADDMGLSVAYKVEREPGSDMDEDSLKAAVESMKYSGCDIALIEKNAPDGLVKRLESDGVRVARIDDMACVSDFDEYVKSMIENAVAVAGVVR